MSRPLDPSWVALVDETIRRKVAAGDTDQEISDAMAMMPFFSVPRGIKPSPLLPKWQHIKTHLALLRLVGTGTAPREAHGLTDRRIRDAAHNVRKRTDRAPTRAQVASELHTSEATVKRAMKALGMTGWPPAPPED
jgi:hypothetical protein